MKLHTKTFGYESWVLQSPFPKELRTGWLSRAVFPRESLSESRLRLVWAGEPGAAQRSRWRKTVRLAGQAFNWKLFSVTSVSVFENCSLCLTNSVLSTVTFLFPQKQYILSFTYLLIHVLGVVTAHCSSLPGGASSWGPAFWWESCWRNHPWWRRVSSTDLQGVAEWQRWRVILFVQDLPLWCVTLRLEILVV